MMVAKSPVTENEVNTAHTIFVGDTATKLPAKKELFDPTYHQR